MSEPETTPEDPPQAAGESKPIIIEKVSGIVKWFNVRCGYGFITRSDNNEDVFVHQTGIAKFNPRKVGRSVSDGETVEFAVVQGDKGMEAAGVTGPDGVNVKGSPYAADRRFNNHQFNRRRRGDGRSRRGGRQQRRPPSGDAEIENEVGAELVQPRRRYFRNRRHLTRQDPPVGAPQGEVTPNVIAGQAIIDEQVDVSNEAAGQVIENRVDDTAAGGVVENHICETHD